MTGQGPVGIVGAHFTTREAEGAPGIWVLGIEGQLVAGNRSLFKEVATAHLDELVRVILPRHRGLVLDLTETTYVDSSGLGALVSVNRRARACGVGFIVAGRNADLWLLFELTKLDTLFNLCDTPDRAIAALRARQRSETTEL